MTETKEKKSGEKKSGKGGLIVIALVALFVVLGAAMFLTSKPVGEGADVSPGTVQAEAPQAVTDDMPSQPEPVATQAPPAEPSAVGAEPTAPASVKLIDVNAALGDRILGNTSAPLKISEHASFTCPHCADFHTKTFPEIKKNYIDTGMAYFVFSDFPLNAPALHASMTARCLPEDKYFDFVSMLFEKQSEWAMNANYLDYLKEKALENGLSEELFKSCIENEEIKTGIENRMRAVQTQWNIAATPSFVINNRVTLSGDLSYDAFKKALDEESARATGATAPAAEEKTGDAPADSQH